MFRHSLSDGVPASHLPQLLPRPPALRGQGSSFDRSVTQQTWAGVTAGRSDAPLLPSAVIANAAVWQSDAKQAMAREGGEATGAARRGPHTYCGSRLIRGEIEDVITDS